MKIKLLGIAAISTLLAANVMAADGNVNFTGEILGSACTVDVGASTALAVSLGKIQKTAFTGVGSAAAATKFTLKLSACPATITKATVKFGGAGYSGDNSVLALTAGTGIAEGVGIQLLDSTNAVLPLETASSPYTLVETEVNNLDFYARYIQKAATVKEGKADSTASFTIVYQ